MTGPLWKDLGALGQARKAGAVSYANNVLALSPLAYWKLNETSGTNAADSSGNSYSGTYSNVTLNAVAGAGTSMGNAGSWNGTSSAVGSFPAGLYSAWPGNEGTLSCWARWTASPSDAFPSAGYFNRSTTLVFALRFIKSSSKFYAHYQVGAANKQPVANAAATQNVWYHIAMTWSYSGNAMKFYVNGTQQSTTQTGLVDYTSVSAMLSGSIGFSTFLGNIAHMALFSSALSQANITTLATAV